MALASSISIAIARSWTRRGRDPAQFDALYRKYLAQVYSYAFYELGDHHEAEDATERTFLAALANLPRFEERARPMDGEGASTFQVWLFHHRPQRRGRAPPPAPPPPGDDRSTRSPTWPAPLDLEADAARRDEARAPRCAP